MVYDPLNDLYVGGNSFDWLFASWTAGTTYMFLDHIIKGEEEEGDREYISKLGSDIIEFLDNDYSLPKGLENSLLVDVDVWGVVMAVFESYFGAIDRQNNHALKYVGEVLRLADKPESFREFEAHLPALRDMFGKLERMAEGNSYLSGGIMGRGYMPAAQN